MLNLYLDDSGTHEGSPVVGVGGLIGTETQWTAFDAAWRTVLQEPASGKPAIRKWSSGDCMRGDGEFVRYNQAAKDQATYRFRDVISNSDIFAASNMIDRIAWEELVTGRFGDKMSSAEATALFALIDRLKPWITTHPSGPKVAIYYDLGRESDPEIKRVAGLLQQAATTLPYIASFTFLRVADATPLQGADMIATESFWFAQDFLGGQTEPSRAHFRAYLEKNFHKGNGAILDRDGIKRDVARRNPDGTIRVSEPAYWNWRAKFS